ncbi:MAG: sulfite exporter TauE/SafE family protein [Candidatus Gracilibacteria bacterium]|nr:sulfite exporter TauE/SafE family protein [Candidatus Gracilibacteria bacterium]
MLFLPIIVAFFASILTFFSGFGIGTILLPVFAIFFPLDIAIAMTGIVHFFNNFFKLFLVGKYYDKKIVLKLGITGIIGAILGAYLLIKLSSLDLNVFFSIFQFEFNTTILKIIIGLLLIIFSVLEMYPKFKNLSFSNIAIYFIGFLSGLFGGLSGHQGALRTAVLTKLNLEKNVFIATGVVIACMVDFTRISIYFGSFKLFEKENILIIFLTTLSAFLGAYIGSKLLKKVTINFIQSIVSILLITLGILIMLGII